MNNQPTINQSKNLSTIDQYINQRKALIKKYLLNYNKEIAKAKSKQLPVDVFVKNKLDLIGREIGIMNKKIQQSTNSTKTAKLIEYLQDLTKLQKSLKQVHLVSPQSFVAPNKSPNSAKPTPTTIPSPTVVQPKPPVQTVTKPVTTQTPQNQNNVHNMFFK
ncbi:MAG: hypothetical protein HC932_01255, partial [Thermales bacterium]|nr:hypothetical protein [Thermales bacterium]